MRRLDPVQVLKNIGRRIADLRRKQRLTQEGLAQQLGISVEYVRRVEIGGANMTMHTLVGWANRLNVDVIDLLKPAGRNRTVSRARRTTPRGGHARAPRGMST